MALKQNNLTLEVGCAKKLLQQELTSIEGRRGCCQKQLYRDSPQIGTRAGARHSLWMRVGTDCRVERVHDHRRIRRSVPSGGPLSNKWNPSVNAPCPYRWSKPVVQLTNDHGLPLAAALLQNAGENCFECRKRHPVVTWASSDAAAVRLLLANQEECSYLMRWRLRETSAKAQLSWRLLSMRQSRNALR